MVIKIFPKKWSIEKFMYFFQTDINIFKFNDKHNCYSKQHSYICSSSTNALYMLNVALLDFAKYKHAVWLDNIEKVCNCFACRKCQMRVFHNYYTFNKHEKYWNDKIKNRELVTSRK
jgi:hypothetical protein